MVVFFSCRQNSVFRGQEDMTHDNRMFTNKDFRSNDPYFGLYKRLTGQKKYDHVRMTEMVYNASIELLLACMHTTVPSYMKSL